ncbi:MAG: pyridoxal-dependent decarboxylase [Phycisphaera sp.]|nr:MAG: pyridoxal-dependent decarboxylase [Phycisphaera sp.]
MNEHPLTSLLADHIEEQIERRRAAPISTPVLPQTIRDHLESSFDFRSPLSAESVFSGTTEMLWNWAEHATNPRHYGLTRPTVDRISIVADALTALYDPNLAMWEFAPGATEIERHVLRVLGRKFGFDIDEGFGNFTSGGAEANHTATIVALTAKFPNFAQGGVRQLEGAPTLYVSDEAHHSFDKVALAVGLGRDAIRRVPVGEDLKMDVKRLEALVHQDRSEGRIPFMVVATAGTTGAGVVDPLHSIARVAAECDLWMHVDGAWGGAAALSESLKPVLKGMDEADSLTVDAHKWLSSPVGAGMFYCRHRQPINQAFSTNAGYVPDLADDGRIYPMYTTMQWSRRCTGLKLFMMLAQHGLGGVVRRIEHQAEMGQRLRGELIRTGWSILNETTLPVICFTHHDLRNDAATHRSMVQWLKNNQLAWISSLQLRENQYALRASITNYESNPDDIDHLVSSLNDALKVELRATCAAASRADKADPATQISDEE